MHLSEIELDMTINNKKLLEETVHKLYIKVDFKLYTAGKHFISKALPSWKHKQSIFHDSISVTVPLHRYFNGNICCKISFCEYVIAV